MEHIETVRKFIVENFLFGNDEKLKDDTSFLNSDILDSTGILELVAFLEETYDFSIEDEEMLPENFDSLINVSSYLVRKLNSES
jgi:acyl carrier protein